jgi:hypothetical protein
MNKCRAEPLEVSLSVFSHIEGGNKVLPLCFVVADDINLASIIRATYADGAIHRRTEACTD